MKAWHILVYLSAVIGFSLFISTFFYDAKTILDLFRDPIFELNLYAGPFFNLIAFLGLKKIIKEDQKQEATTQEATK